MKKNAFIAILLLMTVALFGCEKNDKNDLKSETPAVNQNTPMTHNSTDLKKAPEFSLRSVSGKEVKLSDYKGKVVIVDFWATWCPPCRKGIPDLIDLQKKYKDNLVIIGISVDGTNTINDVKPFVKDQGINYPIVFTSEKVINDFGGIEAIPTSFIIDKDGNIVDSHVGLVPKDVLSNKIETLIQSKS